MSTENKPTLAERLRYESKSATTEYKHEVFGRAADAIERLAAIDEVTTEAIKEFKSAKFYGSAKETHRKPEQFAVDFIEKLIKESGA